MTDWDAQYKERKWDSVRSLEQAPHYGIIASYVIEGEGKSVLDVGCGIGLLALYCPHRVYYHGIDISLEAIDTAKTFLHYSKVEIADATDYKPRRAYDYIVFNETLYYMDDPVSVLKRYTPKIAFIISICSMADKDSVWKEIHSFFKTTHGCLTKTLNSSKSWQVELLS